MGTPQPARSRDRSGKAVLSLILGIASLFIVPLVTGVIAIVLGWIARRDIEQSPALGGRGLATAGMVLGAIGVVLGILMLFMAPRAGWAG